MELTPDVRAELRAALVDRRREAEARLASTGQHFRDIVDASAGSNADDEHDPEGATIAFERSQVDALGRLAQQDLDDAGAAIARLDGGQYGRCEVCGHPIPVERLRARPTARACVGCAGR